MTQDRKLRTAQVPALQARPWSGTWVADRLEVEVRTTHAPLGLDMRDLVGLAVRRNPRRAHLLVSTILGKHVPTDPRLVYGSGMLLGSLVEKALAAPAGAPHPGDRAGGQLLGLAMAGVPGASTALVTHAQQLRRATAAVPAGTVVLGYAETATALAHAVADALDVAMVHSTRRRVPGVTPVGGFEEEHSHATSHLVMPEDPALLAGSGPLVLVDDELSTGTTALNTIAALQAVHPRPHYAIAALVDLRSDADRERMARIATEVGARIDVVALAAGRVELPADVLTAGRLLVEQTEATQPTHPTHPTQSTGTTAAAVRRAPVHRVTLAARPGVREGGRHGFTPADRAALEEHLAVVAVQLTEVIGPGSVHVLGFEELMYAPVRLAQALTALLPDRQVTSSSTTRSPVLAVADDGYAIRSRLVFPAHDDPSDGPGDRYAYNVAAATGSDDRFDTVVLVVDATGDTPELSSPDGLLAQLTGVTDRVVLVVLEDYRPPRDSTVIPATPGEPEVSTPGHRDVSSRSSPPRPLRGPEFGSYRADDVSWLLKDLSHADLEAPTEEREEAIQLGGAHYAESLPMEFQPDDDYQQLFSDALEASAGRVAYAVGLVTEQVLALRGTGVVLVSLARAGTPIGVLMRRWAQFRHGLDVEHYAISIVRGKGIDRTALRYLAMHHQSADIMFVDGWTGKGAITRELAASVAEANDTLNTGFAGEMAVLADTGSCCEVYGTREDYLIPSACLNSTVSGLVSRTVLNDDYVGPGDFHGAKFYSELAGADVSRDFVDAIAARFASVVDRVDADLDAHLASDRTPTWAGWAAVERVSDDYGIGNVNLVKPGVGETTRVLLRRVPWKILVHPAAAAELQHVQMLAEQRGVDIVEVPDLPYSCIGLIHPQFTRGATGPDGTASTAGARSLGTDA